jgi:hypothetical protein
VALHLQPPRPVFLHTSLRPRIVGSPHTATRQARPGAPLARPHRFAQQDEHTEPVEIVTPLYQTRIDDALRYSRPAQRQVPEKAVNHRQTRQRPGQRITSWPLTPHQKGDDQTCPQEQYTSSPSQDRQVNSLAAIATTQSAQLDSSPLSQQPRLVPYLLPISRRKLVMQQSNGQNEKKTAVERSLFSAPWRTIHRIGSLWWFIACLVVYQTFPQEPNYISGYITESAFFPACFIQTCRQRRTEHRNRAPESAFPSINQPSAFTWGTKLPVPDAALEPCSLCPCPKCETLSHIYASVY